MPNIETSTRKITARLNGDGWTNTGGGRHDRFIRADRPGIMIVVPRHREVTIGTARSIAKAAAWI